MLASAKVRDLIQEATKQLEEAGIIPAHHEAERLLSHLLHVKPIDLYIDELPVDASVLEKMRGYLEKREQGVPLQYLLGETDFFGRPFIIQPGVFIPRPETEAVLEAALVPIRRLMQQRQNALWLLDAGTGSGCIAVTLALELPACVVVGLDVSWKALLTAAANIRRHGVSKRVFLLQGHWYEPVRASLFDVIVSNPPYVPTHQVNQLPLEVRCEPWLSLDGGRDGRKAVGHLLDGAATFLRPGGMLVFECGEEQAAILKNQALRLAWVREAEIVKDLAARPRGIIIHRS